MEQLFKYYAFISYSSYDMKWGKKLQQKLEHYRMPATLCSKHGWKRTPMKPVFFAPTDIQPGGLTEELQERLKASRNLIVICSPHSAQSIWVGKEIEFFHNLGRTKQIHFFIVEGTPHSGDKDTECFNPILEKLGLPEILGASIHEKVYPWSWMNRERAYVQLISKLLGVEYDTIWQRHRQQLFMRCTVWLIGLAAVSMALLGVWQANKPVNVLISLQEQMPVNTRLPSAGQATITLSMENETKTAILSSPGKPATFANIPQRLLGHLVHITMSCKDFLPLDTTVTLSRDIKLPICRDPNVYGNIRFCLWDMKTEQPMPHASLKVDGIEMTSDDEGNVQLYIPLERQRITYSVSSSSVLLADTVVGTPCTESTIVRATHE